MRSTNNKFGERFTHPCRGPAGVPLKATENRWQRLRRGHRLPSRTPPACFRYAEKTYNLSRQRSRRRTPSACIRCRLKRPNSSRRRSRREIRGPRLQPNGGSICFGFRRSPTSSNANASYPVLVHQVAPLLHASFRLASRLTPCASLTLHFHQVGLKTFTSERSNMLGTHLPPAEAGSYLGRHRDPPAEAGGY